MLPGTPDDDFILTQGRVLPVGGQPVSRLCQVQQRSVSKHQTQNEKTLDLRLLFLGMPLAIKGRSSIKKEE